jgi:hypothetical protein
LPPVDSFFTNDPELDKNYKNINTAIKLRMKYVLIYNAVLCFGLFYYGRNISFFRKKYGSEERTIFSVLKSSMLHLFMPPLLLMPNIFILFGMHPIKYWKEKQKIESEFGKGESFNHSVNSFTNFIDDEIKTPFHESLQNYTNK